MALQVVHVLVTADHPVAQVHVLAIVVHPAQVLVRVLAIAGHLVVVQAHAQVIAVVHPAVLLPEVHIAQAHHPVAVHPEVEEAVAEEAEADADKKAK